MTTATLTVEETTTLNQLTAELKGLCAELKMARSKAEFNKKFEEKVATVLGEMETVFGIVSFRPEVPAATQKMFFSLLKTRC